LAWTPRPRSHQDAAAGKSAVDLPPRRPQWPQHTHPPILPPTAAPSCAKTQQQQQKKEMAPPRLLLHRRRLPTGCPAARRRPPTCRLAGDSDGGPTPRITRPAHPNPPW
jgi:hypothetical protein